ncbi:hypothetical protein F5Y13DRAFT_168871 [Hypoxylon sp. FL1857]|nr:hypothetical protein F5Y13DRAFT_168871 [Hypoxylon sp. FL1857]
MSYTQPPLQSHRCRFRDISDCKKYLTAANLSTICLGLWHRISGLHVMGLSHPPRRMPMPCASTVSVMTIGTKPIGIHKLSLGKVVVGITPARRRQGRSSYSLMSKSGLRMNSFGTHFTLMVPSNVVVGLNSVNKTHRRIVCPRLPLPLRSESKIDQNVVTNCYNVGRHDSCRYDSYRYNKSWPKQGIIIPAVSNYSLKARERLSTRLDGFSKHNYAVL